MNSVSLTLLLCFITAISRILLKRGMENSNPLTGMVVSLIIGWVTLASLTMFLVPVEAYNWKGILFFALIGTIAPPVVRYLTYIGVDKVGASRSDPVRSLTPFFSILFAVLFLGEEVNRYLILGAVLIFSGVLLISRDGLKKESVRKWSKKDLLYPLFAALLAGGIANMRKYGSTLLESSLLGATVAATSALFIFGIFLLNKQRWKKIVLNRSTTQFFLFSGLCTSATDILDIAVLKMGKVSIVSPLLAASPLFIIALSFFFLKGIEKITPFLIFGAILIFSGIETILVLAR